VAITLHTALFVFLATATSTFVITPQGCHKLPVIILDCFDQIIGIATSAADLTL
jgi:hypothetical protein